MNESCTPPVDSRRHRRGWLVEMSCGVSADLLIPPLGTFAMAAYLSDCVRNLYCDGISCAVSFSAWLEVLRTRRHRYGVSHRTLVPLSPTGPRRIGLR